jgi:hypothetical protein
MDNVKDVADKAASVVDKGVSDAVQVATHTAQDLLARGSEIWDTAKVCAVPRACVADRAPVHPLDSTAAGLGAPRRQQGGQGQRALLVEGGGLRSMQLQYNWVATAQQLASAVRA